MHVIANGEIMLNEKVMEMLVNIIGLLKTIVMIKKTEVYPALSD